MTPREREMAKVLSDWIESREEWHGTVGVSADECLDILREIGAVGKEWEGGNEAWVSILGSSFGLSDEPIEPYVAKVIRENLWDLYDSADPESPETD